MNLPWQEANKASLSAAVESGRLPHALLLSAYPGWGAAVLGEWLALKVLALEGTPEARRLAHPDLRWLAPEKGVIPVDAIRRLRDFSVGAPQMAPAKAVVLEDADRMNVNAANALLKTLEEPSANTYLILTSQRAGTLPPTIRSRCQKVAIARNAEAAKTWLTDANARQLLDDYDGAPLLALAGAEEGERPMAEMLSELGRGGRERTAALVEEMLALDPARLSARWARCLVNAMSGAAPSLGRAAADRPTFAFIDELQWFHLQVVVSSSANVRLLLERLCHRWCQLVAG
ncbi:MAG: hypothetical protein F4Z84_12805 [Gammaproteobacteria bacterium]|nr:hypothetical protein [Gammaproteobacteria bacterium]